MRFICRTILVVCTLLCFVAQAQAAAQTYLVLPFTVKGSSSLSHLETAVPSMLNSRLFVKGKTRAVASEGTFKQAADNKEAKAALDKSQADYVVWGVVNDEGDKATINVRVLDAAGKEWKRTLKTSHSSMIVGLQRLADTIVAEVFGIGGAPGAQARSATPMNPAFVSNEPVQRQAYLNPQFRYQGVDSSRMRSQALPFAAVGMEIADVNGDGKNEVIILDDHKVLVFEWGPERMKQLGEYQLPMTEDALTVRAMDVNGDKAAEIIVTMFDAEHTMPRGIILSFKGGQFSVLADRVPYYLNVIKMPPFDRPTFIGQRGDSGKIFSTAGIFEMILTGNSVSPGTKINLPSDANALNFAWLPGSKGDVDKLVVLDKTERIAIFSNKLSPMGHTDEKYSGSSIGIENQMNMPGLGRDDVLIPRMYHIPLRMLPVDLEGRGEWTLLVNKPISVAAQFFDRYRFFPEGEIHDMFWDGVGLNLLWKTRRIKGSVVDFNVGDVANDGSQYLVVCINTHPGAMGFSKRRTVVLAYPLDASQTDPNTPIVLE